jgi:site-specific DNA-methyltransferase (adenine-specific)
MLGMAEMPDNYVDLAIVDPPYGKSTTTWDKLPNTRYFQELFRISKNQIIWGMNFLNDNLGRCHCVICWDKCNDNIKSANFEIAWTSFNKQPKIYRYPYYGYFLQWENIIHPCQKPVDLYKWLLSNYAQPGDLILDTHMGSGSSYIAALDMGFDYIGFEIDEDYFKGIQDRVYHFTRQRSLL